MKYLMLIYANEAATSTLAPDEMNSMIAGYGAFTAEAQEKKVYAGGNPLQPSSTATTVRVREGKTLITDGPFAETKEQLGGYYLLECRDLDEALEYAAKIPGAAYGSVEVRPIIVFH
ncbi:MAG: YciI family protein [Bryobacteraceae bacterium]|jgi:hypothetical protein